MTDNLHHIITLGKKAEMLTAKSEKERQGGREEDSSYYLTKIK